MAPGSGNRTGRAGPEAGPRCGTPHGSIVEAAAGARKSGGEGDPRLGGRGRGADRFAGRWIGGEWSLADVPGSCPLSWSAAAFLGGADGAGGGARDPRDAAPARITLWSSGRAALRAALDGLGASGQAVLLPAFGCPALGQAVRAAGGLPRYCAGDGRGGPDWRAMADLSARTGARLAVVVHAFGLPPDPTAMRDAAARGLRLVEDCSHTLCNAPGAARAGGASATVASLRKMLPVPAGGLCRLWERPDAHGTGPADRRPPGPGGPHPVPPAPQAVLEARARALALAPGPERHRLLQRWERLLDAAAPEGAMGMSAFVALRRLAACPPAGLASWRAACRRNRAALVEALAGTACRPLHADLPQGACPPGLVVRHAERTRLAAALLARGIEAWLQWPVAPEARPYLTRAERLLAGTVLTLPCDGRWGQEDMERVAAAVRDAEAAMGLRGGRASPTPPPASR